MPKLKAKCCKKYQRKHKACKKCPVRTAVGKEQKMKHAA